MGVPGGNRVRLFSPPHLYEFHLLPAPQVSFLQIPESLEEMLVQGPGIFELLLR